MVETFEQTHDIAPVPDQRTPGIEAVFDLAPQGAGLPLETGHCREVLGKALRIIVEVAANAFLKDNQRSIHNVEEFVDRFDKAERLLCRK